MTDSWKSFWLGTAAAIIVAVIAGVVLQSTSRTTGEAFSTSSTRL